MHINSLFARIALILLSGLLAAQSVSLWLQWGERARVVSQTRGLHLAARIADAVRMLEAGNPAQRRSSLAALTSPELDFALISPEEVYPNAPRGGLQAAIFERLGSTREIRTPGGSGIPQKDQMVRRFDVRLTDGQWVRLSAAREGNAPALPDELLVRLLTTLALIIAVVMLAVREATKPLKQLAQAADALGHDIDAPPLAETGPVETRQAAQAFNRMQARIRHLIDERARALAAVSHDLRTPLTRLRLRAELIDDPQLRNPVIADLDDMTALLDASLDYLRGLEENETPCPVDLNALLQSLSADAAVIGRKIRIEGTSAVPFCARHSALRRALQNLIDNAFKYGRDVLLCIEEDAHEVRLCVKDAGPGIDPEELERVTEPYYRPDAARRRETGGVGLGLSIVRDVARLHGGKLHLANRPQGGLSATLVLPR